MVLGKVFCFLRFLHTSLHHIFRARGFGVFGFLPSRQVHGFEACTELDLWLLPGGGLRTWWETSQGRVWAAGPSPGEGLAPPLWAGAMGPKACILLSSSG